MTEWVEIKGANVDIAVEAGLAELGLSKVDHAEVEILQAPEKGFLGIGRQDAIVRVKPRPRPKRKRSRGRGASGEQRSGGRGSRQGGQGSDRSSRGGRDRGDQRGGSQGGQGGKSSRAGRNDSRDQGGRGNRNAKDRQEGDGRRSGGSQRNAGGRNDRRPARQSAEREAEANPVDINEQAGVIGEFLSGLLNSFGLDGTVDVRVDDEVIYADINGEQTEALIGPKAAILQSIHELTKTVVQRKTMAGVRLRLDIGGYAERRREALTIYAGRVAEQVLDDNEEIVLETMNPADRKAVHDAIADIDGVRSYSEGEDPRRSVVLSPDN